MQYAFLAMFGLVWSIAILGFDGLAARSFLKQFESRNYAVTTGYVIHSDLKHNRSSYEAEINYRYIIDNHKYYGNRLRYNQMNGNASSASASGIVAAHQLGAMTPVYYNPKNPQDALLFPGIEGTDFALVLFLTPFNCIMLAFWMWMGGWLRQRLLRPVAGGVKIIAASGMRTRVQLPRNLPAAWALGTTGGLGFVSVFIVAVSSNMQPSLGFVLTTIGVVYLAGVGVYLWHWQKLQSGINDLVINLAARTLDLPQTFGRKQLLTVNIADIESLTVEKLTHRSTKGGTSYTYAPTLSLRGPNPGIQKLADWMDQKKANRFTDWLRKQIGC